MNDRRHNMCQFETQIERQFAVADGILEEWTNVDRGPYFVDDHP